jgi:hypothetical protein
MLGVEAVEGARAAMDGFMAAFNARDADAIRLAGSTFRMFAFMRNMTMMTPADYHNLVWDSQGQSAGLGSIGMGPGRGRSAPGPEKVHFRVQFTRYRADGSAIGGYRSLPSVTLRDGRWAIQGRSSWAE